MEIGFAIGIAILVSLTMALVIISYAQRPKP